MDKSLHILAMIFVEAIFFYISIWIGLIVTIIVSVESASFFWFIVGGFCIPCSVVGFSLCWIQPTEVPKISISVSAVLALGLFMSHSGLIHDDKGIVPYSFAAVPFAWASSNLDKLWPFRQRVNPYGE